MGRLRRFLPPQVADLIVASGTEKQLESHRREKNCAASRLGVCQNLREVARRCRVRSRDTFDLTAAGARQTAADLEDKALQCEGIDCDDEPRSMAHQRRPF